MLQHIEGAGCADDMQLQSCKHAWWERADNSRGVDFITSATYFHGIHVAVSGKENPKNVCLCSQLSLEFVFLIEDSEFFVCSVWIFLILQDVHSIVQEVTYEDNQKGELSLVIMSTSSFY